MCRLYSIYQYNGPEAIDYIFWCVTKQQNEGGAGDIRGQKTSQVMSAQTGTHLFKDLTNANVKPPKIKNKKECVPTKKNMQDQHQRSVAVDLNKSRHTISRMPCKRHRKSLYWRHREQLWGDKKGNWYYWDGWGCLFAWTTSLYCSRRNISEWKKEISETDECNVVLNVGDEKETWRRS